MNAFKELRKQAAKKREAAIRLAHREYEATLLKIAELERHIAGPGQRVKRHDGANPPQFTLADLDYLEVPSNEMTLAESMCEVLRARGPLRKIELLVYVLESGYKTAMPRRSLTSYAGNLLRTRRHLFKSEAGKWSLVSP